MAPKFNADRAKNYLSYRLGAFPGGSGLSGLRREYEQPLWLLLATAGLVLLIACANLANLLLARASAREREIAVRLALGASRGRLVRQLLEESLLLASAGAALGTALALALSRLLVSFLSTADQPLFLDLHPDWRVVGFSAALAILTCVLFGLTPALRATRAGPAGGLKIAGRGVTAGRERFGLRRVLVVTQVALSLVLLAGALLFARSLRNLLTLDAGFQQDGVLVLNADLTPLKLPAERRLPFKQELLDRVRRMPGVESAAQALIIPLGGDGYNDWVWQEDEAQKKVSTFNWVSPGYFRTMGMALVAGRDFDEHDDRSATKVAIVTQSFARKVLNTTNPIGKTFRQSDLPENVYQVVGLVKDSKYGDLHEDFDALAFLPLAQQKEPNLASIIVIRSDASLVGLVSSLKAAVAEQSPAITFDFRVFRQQVRETLMRERLMATLSGFFGFLAALLATIGLYGVISYMVAQRRNEIGIRMALGAGRSRVLGLVMREALLLLAIGLAVGAALTAVGARSARALLFNVEPNDPVTLGLAVATLAAVALAASYLPAHRASRLDPMIALREE